MSLISRKLLTPDEVLKIESPYLIVMIAGKPPALLTVPDISQMHFNKLNGMGTKEENQKLRIERENQRPIRKISKSQVWNIWDEIKQQELDEMEEEEEELRTLQKNWTTNRKGRNVIEDKQGKNEESD